MRIKLSELTFKRIVEALQRRIFALKEYYDWRFTKEGTINRSKFLKYKNIHAGKRCFIIANGPSLANTDLSFLQNEITFCMNRFYLLFDKLNFIPTYYVVSNELVLEQFAEDLAEVKSIKFFNWAKYKRFENVSKINYLFHRFSLQDGFSTKIEKGIYSGGTVTFTCLQLAYFMGFNEVYIVGLDHNFVDKGIPNKTEIRESEKDENHFHSDYFPKGIKWQLPDLLRSEIAYKKAKDIFELDSRSVFDATINGKCTVFPKVQFLELFS